ncbi:MAG: hypothetical protein V7677_17575, partial [Motiliproteus sp.]
MISIRTALTQPKGFSRILIILAMLLLFGLQSAAISTSLTKMVDHSFSIAEHQGSLGAISTHHEGCSALESPDPQGILDTVPLLASCTT